MKENKQCFLTKIFFKPQKCTVQCLECYLCWLNVAGFTFMRALERPCLTIGNIISSNCISDHGILVVLLNVTALSY